MTSVSTDEMIIMAKALSEAIIEIATEHQIPAGAVLTGIASAAATAIAAAQASEDQIVQTLGATQPLTPVRVRFIHHLDRFLAAEEAARGPTSHATPSLKQ